MPSFTLRGADQSFSTEAGLEVLNNENMYLDVNTVKHCEVQWEDLPAVAATQVTREYTYVNII